MADDPPPVAAETAPAPALTGNGKGYFGTKPPFPCNKPSGVCGYINCALQGECLHLTPP